MLKLKFNLSFNVLSFSGHNTDGKYFVTSNKLSYNCETKPRPVKCYFEVKDGRYINIPDVKITDVACGTNHTVSMPLQ